MRVSSIIPRISYHTTSLTRDHGVPYSKKMKELDANGDGLVTFVEYLDMSRMTTVEQAMERWVKFDFERKGYLTFDEAYERKA